MGRSRYTIAGGMVAVALAALAMAAVARPTRDRSDAVFSLAIASNFIAVVVAIARPGPTRAVGSSFAVCGSGYLFLVFGPYFAHAFGPHLITSHAIEWFVSRSDTILDADAFSYAAHSLYGVAAGMTGGLLAWCLSRMGTDPDLPTLGPDEPS